jgi:uncharacterized protein
MERLFTLKLKEWGSTPKRKPLIIRGARQVGKSYIVQDFGKTHFNEKIHTVDFEKHPEWIGIFEKNLDPVRIISELELLLNTSINTATDLLFFDEIQVAPKAIMSLRYFYEEMPGLHLIAAGSLLEFAMQKISFPVGRVSILNMTPMNFYEFLKNTGKEKLADIILEKPTRLSDTIHSTLLDALRQYMFIGGMPECVELWRNSNSMTEVFKVQNDLMETYRQDFSKYSPYTDKRSLNHALSSIARNIGHQVKYSSLSEEFTGPTNKKALELLSLARVISRISSASVASLPFESTASEKKFKALLVDIGLMRSLNNLPPDIEYTKNDLLSMYNGALAEQFAGQEFLSSGRDKLYYWIREAKSSSAEVDFILSKKNKIFPVEIKGGAAGKLRSMHLLLEKYPHIKTGYILSTAPYGELREQKLVFLPLYYAYSLAGGQ